MDENKKRTADQEIEPQKTGEKTGVAPEHSAETDIGNQRTKECNTIEDCLNHTKSSLPFEAANNAVKPNTTAMQDLFAAMGIGSWKPQKKTASNELPEKTTEAIVEKYQQTVGENAEKNSGVSEGEHVREGIDNALASAEDTGHAPVKRGFTRKRLLIPLIILCSLCGYWLYAYITEPKPPSEDVVATYSGKNLTKENLLTYIQNSGYKYHPIDSLEAYRQIIRMIAVQQIIDDWAREKGIAQKNEVKHDFKHLVEEVNLDKLVDKVHQDQLSPDKIDKWEVQKYYDANKDTYKDKPFNEVEGEIRNILATEKDKNFFPEYIEKLKKNASLTINYDLLRVEDPAQTELRKNEALFTIHGKLFTLRQFNEEFKELSPEVQAKFTGFEKKKQLIDQLIAKELLLEEAGDDVADKENGKKIEEMKSQYLSQILHKEEIDEKIGQISDEEAKKFYEERKNDLVEPAKAQISLIRVEQGPSEAEKTRARQMIDEALQKLTSGADFAAIAKEYSSDSTALTGGELKNWLYDNKRLDPVLRKTIFNLQPNAISGVLEYKGGYYIVKLRQKEAQRQRPFEEVKEQIKKVLLDEKHLKKEAALEAELLAKAQLIIYDSSLKAMMKETIKTSI